MKPRECENFKPICECIGFKEEGIAYCTGENDGIKCSDIEDCLMCHWYRISGCEYLERNSKIEKGVITPYEN